MGIVDMVREIARPARIICEPCHSQDGAIQQIEAHHSFAPGASAKTLRHLKSAEHRALLGFSNGFVLFDTEHLPSDQLGQNGLCFFALEEIQDEKDEFLRLMDEQSSGEELEENEESLQLWYEGFVPVAAPCSSGDLIVLDTARPGTGPEPRVLFLDHEYFYGGPFDESFIQQQWPSLSTFLAEFAKDPAAFLLSNWRAIFDGNPSHQYMPRKVIYSTS